MPWLGAQHTLLASAAATIASCLAATVILTTRRREPAPEAPTGSHPAVGATPGNHG